MIDIKLIRETPDLVKENIKKKFQDDKLPLVDEVAELDVQVRKAQTEADDLRNLRAVKGADNRDNADDDEQADAVFRQPIREIHALRPPLSPHVRHTHSCPSGLSRSFSMRGRVFCLIHGQWAQL